MKMYIKSVLVDDQAKALEFYTSKLGFRLKHDIPLGEFRWLTVVSPEEPEGVELGLEPNQHPASKTYQQALKSDGIPCTAFRVDSLQAEVDRLEARGVVFTVAPVSAGGATIAIFDDTCGNLVQLVEISD